MKNINNSYSYDLSNIFMKSQRKKSNNSKEIRIFRGFRPFVNILFIISDLFGLSLHSFMNKFGCFISSEKIEIHEKNKYCQHINLE